MANGPTINRRRLVSLFMQSTVAYLLARGADSATAQPAPAASLEGYIFLTRAEGKFLEAATSRIIPADELGPGAKEAGAVVFLDRELGGDYGANVRTYVDGPYGAYTPYPGYQLPLTVADIYRVSIAAVNRYCQEAKGKAFADLDPETQDAILRGVDQVGQRVSDENPAGKWFFQLLLRDTRDSFFSDPIYGGNRGMIGWKLIGYPGAGGNYLQAIFRTETPYRPEPAGMAEHQHKMGMGGD